MSKQKQRFVPPDKRKMRNLTQFRDMSDEEFNSYFEENYANNLKLVGIEGIIQEKYEEFEQDYDLSDMKFNDKEVLRGLCEALAVKEYLEERYHRIMEGEGITLDNLTLITKLEERISAMRKDISNMQEDLNITRKNRSKDKEESVRAEWENLQARAQKFYRNRMAYVYCDKCANLLATVWFHYPNGEKNILEFFCERILDDSGEICGNTVKTTSEELMKTRGINIPDKVPDF